MKKISAIILSGILMISFSCSESNSSSENADESPVQEFQASQDTASIQNMLEQPAEINQEVIHQSAPISPSAPAGNNSGAALNPAHGEPGHDCAIAVGAPMNSPKTAPTQPVQLNNSTVNPSGVQINPAPNPAPAPTPVIAAPSIQSPAGTSGKLNPAHGEPGHDCAKPVGSPL